MGEKKQRDRLRRLAQQHLEWEVGYLDEVWWSRLAQPAMHTWGAFKEPLRLVQREKAAPEPGPVALACYGLLRPALNQAWLRFVQGQPVSHVTVEFLTWGGERLAQAGKTAWLLVWDNASWHRSHEGKTWIQPHNRKAKEQGGVRIIVAHLPLKSLWLNPLEAHGVHGKRALVEPQRRLTAQELMERVCAYYEGAQFEHLSQKVA